MVLIPVYSSVSDPYLKRLYRAQSDPFKGTTDVVISSDPLFKKGHARFPTP